MTLAARSADGEEPPVVTEPGAVGDAGRRGRHRPDTRVRGVGQAPDARCSGEIDDLAVGDA